MGEQLNGSSGRCAIYESREMSCNIFLQSVNGISTSLKKYFSVSIAAAGNSEGFY